MNDRLCCANEPNERSLVINTIRSFESLKNIISKDRDINFCEQDTAAFLKLKSKQKKL